MLGLAYSVPSVLRIRIEPDPSRDLEGRLFFIGKGGDVTEVALGTLVTVGRQPLSPGAPRLLRSGAPGAPLHGLRLGHPGKGWTTRMRDATGRCTPFS
jgi:hypothetical protein